MRFIPALLLVALAFYTNPLASAPPPGADPNSSLSKWYQSLTQPETGVGCCSEADCRAYSDDKVRVRDGAWQVFIDDDWRTVPPERVLRQIPNPTGEAVACWTPWQGVLCFVVPTET